jgi:hypothetical protein
MMSAAPPQPGRPPVLHHNQRCVVHSSCLWEEVIFLLGRGGARQSKPKGEGLWGEEEWPRPLPECVIRPFLLIIEWSTDDFPLNQGAL